MSKTFEKKCWLFKGIYRKGNLVF